MVTLNLLNTSMLAMSLWACRTRFTKTFTTVFPTHSHPRMSDTNATLSCATWPLIQTHKLHFSISLWHTKPSYHKAFLTRPHTHSHTPLHLLSLNTHTGLPSLSSFCFSLTVSALLTFSSAACFYKVAQQTQHTSWVFFTHNFVFSTAGESRVEEGCCKCRSL